ncbi:MAG TPA: ECF-type sigma factor [Humisphaera sp.]
MTPAQNHPVPCELWTDVYAELRRAATRLLLGERKGLSVGATDLVGEAFVRLGEYPQPRERTALLRLAAHVIRNILVDRARARRRTVRSAVPLSTALTQAGGGTTDPVRTDLVALDVALTRLSRVNPDAALVVELRFFGGLTETEAAAAIGVSRRTVTQQWQYARLWLHREIRETVGTWN